MPSDPAKRGAWYRSVLLDKSLLKTSDLAAAESGKKKEHLKAPAKLLIRGAHGDVILSGSKTDLSVVTSCKPATALIGKNDQVFLRVMERSVIERIVAPLGRRIDESSPMVDARLADVPRLAAEILAGGVRGRVVVDVRG